MNKQTKTNKDGSISRGIEWTDYTFNPIRGCMHGCEWTMPDGSIANCYAEDVADGIAQNAYPLGFEHHYWQPEILDKPLKQKRSSRIFVGSMADVFGHWVPATQIEEVLEMCDKAHWHTFQFLTKNPKRVAQFADYIPKNCWIGASTPPDKMWNKALSGKQRYIMLDATMRSLYELRNTYGITTWMSAEPLTINVGQAINGFSDWENYPARPIDWIVIGAASNGRIEYAPDLSYVKEAIENCDAYSIPVFFKGNMRSLEWAKNNWREEFPNV